MPQIIKLGRLVSQSPGGDLITPLSLSPSAYWRSDQGVTQSTNLVSAWTSIEGNSRVFPAAGTARPTYAATGFRGRPGLLFNGTTNFMRIASWLGGVETEISLFVVFKLEAVAASKYVLNLVETGNNYGGGGDWITINTSAASKWTTRLSSPSGDFDATPGNAADLLGHVGIFEFQGGAKVSLQVDADGLAQNTTSVPATIDLDGFVEIGALQGTRVSPAFLANVTIAEVAIFDRVLSDSEKTSLKAYANSYYELYWPITITEIVPQGGLHNAFPSLCRRSTGELLLTYRTATSHSSPGVNGVLNLKRSFDDGNTWGAATQILAVSGRDIRVGMVRELNDLTLAMTSMHATANVDDHTTQYLTSADGTTWVSNEVASGYTQYTATECPVVQMPNGDLILAVQGKNTGDTHASCKVLKSTDGGVNWSVLKTFTSPGAFFFAEPFIQLLSDGRLLCLIRGGDSNIYASESTDDGVTWSVPIVVFPGKSRPAFIELPDERLRAFVRSPSLEDHRFIDHIGLSTAASAAWSGVFRLLDPSPIQVYADAVLLSTDHGNKRLLAVWGTENLGGNLAAINQSRLEIVGRQE